MEKVLIGAGGFAREVSAQLSCKVIKFVEDDYYTENNESIFPLSTFNCFKHHALVAIGDSTVRRRIVETLPEKTTYFVAIHPSAQILDKNIHIDCGSVICPNCILTTNIIIGSHCQLNLATTIGHDCKIGNYFTTAPGAKISGNCTIGDCVYVGTNTSIKEKINICSNVIIGMGSVVVKDITEPGVYAGVPVKRIGD